MTDDDIEWLLRRTFREVAARTDATPSVPMSKPIEPGVRRRWQPVLAAAAVLVVVVAGLVVLTGRGGEAPAAMGEPRHIVPSWIPRADSDETERLFALTEIESTAGLDRLVWSADVGSVTLAYDRLASTLPPGTATTVRGADAVETADSVAWFGPAGGVATITIDGDVDPRTLDEITRSLVYLDDETWTRLTEFHGFGVDEGDELVTVRIEGDVNPDVVLTGELHTGFSIQIGFTGFRPGFPGCFASLNEEFTEFPDRPDDPAQRIAFTILSAGPSDTLLVRADGEPDRIITTTSLEPMLDMTIGTVTYRNRPIGAARPECGAGQ